MKALILKTGWMWKPLEEPDKEKFKSQILQPSEDVCNRRNVFLKERINLVHKRLANVRMIQNEVRFGWTNNTRITSL